jgi:hypothetical protein
MAHVVLALPSTRSACGETEASGRSTRATESEGVIVTLARPADCDWCGKPATRRDENNGPTCADCDRLYKDDAKNATRHERMRRVIMVNNATRIFDVARTLTPPWTLEDLVVACWKAHPDQFGMQGRRNEYPCSQSVLSKVYGDRGLIRRGLVVWIAQNQYTAKVASRG